MFGYAGKCLLIVIVMFLGVLFGMQQANNGMLDMKGYHDPSLKGAFTLTDGENNEKEASILGQTVTTKDLEEKQKELEQVESFNVFSKTGKALSDTVTNTAQAVYNWMLELRE
ncbi:YqxA family protein [Bacillus atrophaeus]|uniref:YqxA family protein n=1 Tax=Bacillus atrophaeus TaxID=1452 RepID=UPI002280C536|nr:YqxA family protein [Bacillus atrophaeus]MCY8946157.1 YqxA family protein [Bacillus atrophaeus]